VHGHIIINQPDNLIYQECLFSRSVIALRRVFAQASLNFGATFGERGLQNFEDVRTPRLRASFPHHALNFFRKRASIDNIALFANAFRC
jgi:hypothetical protein